MKPELGGDSHFSGTTNFARPTRSRKGHITSVPFTVKELKSMYGLTVEEALAKGFDADWYNKKKAASEAGTSSAAHDKKSHGYDTTQSEECQMENIRTRVALVLCLMESKTLQSTNNDVKIEMLSQLLYDQPITAEVDAPRADKPKHAGGRPKKAAAPEQNKDGEA